MEEKILSLYAAGMSIKDIAEQIKALYDVEISLELVSKISDFLKLDSSQYIKALFDTPTTEADGILG